MTPNTKIAAGFAGGYLLGRTKKLKFALTVGSVLAGQRLADRAVRARVAELANKSEELKTLRDQATGLVEVARDAAMTTVTSRMGLVTERLQDRVDAAEDELRSVSTSAKKTTRKTPTKSASKKTAAARSSSGSRTTKSTSGSRSGG